MTTNYLMTGATSGLGLAAARALTALAPDARLLVALRDPSRAEALRRIMPAARLELVPLDTADLSSVRRAIVAIREALRGDRLAGIACNAGLQFPDADRRSPDGHELTFATNCLGHAVLVEGLLDRLASGAAIVSTASGTHDPTDELAGRFGFRGGLFRSAAPRQAGRDAYATSKLCQILWTYAMGDTHPDLRFIAFDPGLMPGTGLARAAPAPVRFAWRHVLPLLAPLLPGTSTTRRSGRVLARLLADLATAAAGVRHLDDRLLPTESSADSYRPEMQADLMDFVRWVGASEPAPA